MGAVQSQVSEAKRIEARQWAWQRLLVAPPRKSKISVTSTHPFSFCPAQEAYMLSMGLPKAKSYARPKQCKRDKFQCLTRDLLRDPVASLAHTYRCRWPVGSQNSLRCVTRYSPYSVPFYREPTHPHQTPVPKTGGRIRSIKQRV